MRETTREQPRAAWAVVRQDHPPGDISWAQDLLNQQRLAANATRSGARPPREGAALCQGILDCGSCGRGMSTNYRLNGRVDDEGAHSRADHVATAACRVVKTTTVDQVVAARLLHVLGPEEVALALAAADEVTERRARTPRASELALERARGEADRAERAVHACEPAHRLVARRLASRWESKVAALAEAEAALATTSAAVPALPPRVELEALAADLPALWAAPSTSARDRKRLLRTLVADVTVTSQVDGDELRIGIHWRSGSSEQIITRRPPPPPHAARRTPSEATRLIRHLGPILSDEELVAKLNAAGLKTGLGRRFDVAAVQWGRYTRHVPSPSPFQAGELSVDEVAARLRIRSGVVYYWIEHGQLAARRTKSGRVCIAYPPEVEAACRQRVLDSHPITPESRTTLAGAAV